MMTVGTLKVKSKKNKKGNVKKTYEFFYTNSERQYRSLNFDKIPKEQISPELLQKIEDSSSATLAVEFEEEGDLIFKLREQGVSWPEDVSEPIAERSRQTDSLKTVDPNNFHNPYNFVPALPRDQVTGELGDRKPSGHGRYLPDQWSGRISVKLTTVTPLLIPDAAEMTDDDGHKTYPVRLGADGKPYLPPTSLKGMLRSAYEAVTNSRLSVFEAHDARLAYRMPATKGTTAKPARIEKRSNGLYLRILEESSCVGRAAKLPRYEKNGRPSDKGERRAALKYGGSRNLPEHGDCVWVKVAKGKVTHIKKWISEDLPDIDWKLGWVCVTGANIGGKQNERVFIQHDRDPAIRVTPAITELWENLIADYQKVHEKELKERERRGYAPSEYLGNKPGQTAWSRHVYDPSQRKLSEGILCYVELKPDCDFERLHHSDVIALQPVTISRRLYAQKPTDLLPDNLHPAADISELSPADRVFGWVNQKNRQPTQKTSNANAYKGQLRIHSVRCQTSAEKAMTSFNGLGLPLAILGEPKPAQTRFYTAKDKKGAPVTQQVEKEYGYKSTERGLRGRKVYPHHGTLPDVYWSNPTEDRTDREIDGHYQEYRRPTGEKERDSQNKSIKGWVNPQTEFTCDIDVVNLSNVELGALLWVLSLPDNAFHRLGGGKPLGFGSVRLEINWKNSDLRSGENWQQFYRQLTQIDKPAIDPNELIAEYRNATESAYKSTFEKVPFMAAFCRCTKGFENGLPVHYPRISQQIDPEGKNYEWFTDNEAGERLNLPSLIDGESLPLKPRLDKESNGSNKALQR